jgi:hypothetical protein
MPTREELLRNLWSDIIDVHLDASAPRRVAASARSQPADAPFADAVLAMQRLLDAGVDVRDVCLVQRFAAYEAVFQTLYAIGDTGVDGDDVFGLYEELLMADPRGRDGQVS